MIKGNYSNEIAKRWAQKIGEGDGYIIVTPEYNHGYPAVLKTGAQRALYNNLDEDADLALAVDAAIQSSRMDGWRDNSMKTKRVRNAVKGVLTAEQARASYGCEIDNLADRIVELSRHQDEY